MLIQKNTQPSTDFEPEYIAVSDGIAYVSLQEANAIAVLNIASGEFTGVYPLGFQDYGKTEVDLQKNDIVELGNYPNVYGIKMPDGISATTIGGQTYLLTANEGDSRSDWAGLDNESEGKASPTGNVTLGSNVVWFKANLWDGLDTDKAYVFGGRSFSIYEVGDNGLTLVYDSGSGFEEITAAKLPDNFNTSNDKTSIDNRSGKKGPEPESVTVGTANGKTYAFVALERIGGVMVYDITDPANAKFANYINSREFDDAIKGDVSPEGLCFVSAQASKTGKAMLLAACEVSGTLAAYELTPYTADSGSSDSTSSDSTSSDSGSSGSSSSSTTTTTEKNPDGSTTTTTTNKTTGTVTETTKNTDGSTGSTVTDKNGNITEAKASVSTKAVAEAAKTGGAVTLPVKVPTAKATKGAPAVQVTVPKSAGSVKVEIPVEKVTPGTVAVIVDAKGNEKVVSTSKVTEDGIALAVSGTQTVKVIDNSKSFSDVPANHVFYNEITSLSAREIMVGKVGEKFDLYSSVTLNQIVNVAGRITGAVDVKDYNAGITWGAESGLETGDTAATRGDVLKALYMAAGSPAVADTAILAKFADAANIPADMEAIAAWTAQNGILKGSVDGSAGLGSNVTRGQACALAGRTMGTLA